MSGIAIYMEGGGQGHDTKVSLRQGMDAFLSALKVAARAKSWHLKLVSCGGRREAFDAFLNARQTETVVVLLVDAEAPVTTSPRAHLATQDGWALEEFPDSAVHLMIQTMEAWIVADVTALGTYYGKGFKANQLPKTQDLETVARADLATALQRATRASQKGADHKIRHASDLLQRIDPQKVQQKCASCGDFSIRWVK